MLATALHRTYPLYAEGLYRALKRMARLKRPVIITECGIADAADDRSARRGITPRCRAHAITPSHPHALTPSRPLPRCRAHADAPSSSAATSTPPPAPSPTVGAPRNAAER
jgi:hypothetical protein